MSFEYLQNIDVDPGEASLKMCIGDPLNWSTEDSVETSSVQLTQPAAIESSSDNQHYIDMDFKDSFPRTAPVCKVADNNGSQTEINYNLSYYDLDAAKSQWNIDMPHTATTSNQMGNIQPISILTSFSKFEGTRMDLTTPSSVIHNKMQDLMRPEEHNSKLPNYPEPTQEINNVVGHQNGTLLSASTAIEANINTRLHLSRRVKFNRDQTGLRLTEKKTKPHVNVPNSYSDAKAPGFISTFEEFEDVLKGMSWTDKYNIVYCLFHEHSWPAEFDKSVGRLFGSSFDSAIKRLRQRKVQQVWTRKKQEEVKQTKSQPFYPIISSYVMRNIEGWDQRIISPLDQPYRKLLTHTQRHVVINLICQKFKNFELSWSNQIAIRLGCTREFVLMSKTRSLRQGFNKLCLDDSTLDSTAKQVADEMIEIIQQQFFPLSSERKDIKGYESEDELANVPRVTDCEETKNESPESANVKSINDLQRSGNSASQLFANGEQDNDKHDITGLSQKSTRDKFNVVETVDQTASLENTSTIITHEDFVNACKTVGYKDMIETTLHIFNERKWPDNFDDKFDVLVGQSVKEHVIHARTCYQKHSSEQKKKKDEYTSRPPFITLQPYISATIDTWLKEEILASTTTPLNFSIVQKQWILELIFREIGVFDLTWCQYVAAKIGYITKTVQKSRLRFLRKGTVSSTLRDTNFDMVPKTVAKELAKIIETKNVSDVLTINMTNQKPDEKIQSNITCNQASSTTNGNAVYFQPRFENYSQYKFGKLDLEKPLTKTEKLKIFKLVLRKSYPFRRFWCQNVSEFLQANSNTIHSIFDLFTNDSVKEILPTTTEDDVSSYIAETIRNWESGAAIDDLEHYEKIYEQAKQEHTQIPIPSNIKLLETSFSKENVLSSNELMRLESVTGMTATQIKKWFKYRHYKTERMEAFYSTEAERKMPVKSDQTQSSLIKTKKNNSQLSNIAENITMNSSDKVSSTNEFTCFLQTCSHHEKYYIVRNLYMTNPWPKELDKTLGTLLEIPGYRFFQSMLKLRFCVESKNKNGFHKWHNKFCQVRPYLLGELEKWKMQYNSSPDDFPTFNYDSPQARRLIQTEAQLDVIQKKSIIHLIWHYQPNFHVSWHNEIAKQIACTLRFVSQTKLTIEKRPDYMKIYGWRYENDDIVKRIATQLSDKIKQTPILVAKTPKAFGLDSPSYQFPRLEINKPLESSEKFHILELILQKAMPFGKFWCKSITSYLNISRQKVLQSWEHYSPNECVSRETFVATDLEESISSNMVKVIKSWRDVEGNPYNDLAEQNKIILKKMLQEMVQSGQNKPSNKALIDLSTKFNVSQFYIDNMFVRLKSKNKSSKKRAIL